MKFLATDVLPFINTTFSLIHPVGAGKWFLIAFIKIGYSKYKYNAIKNHLPAPTNTLYLPDNC